MRDWSVYILASRRYGTRDWKIALIERENPEWRDLAGLVV
jgi:predicted GIY-YIG superfamily endonuclease